MASGGLGAAAPNVNLPADNAPQLAAGWFTGRGTLLRKNYRNTQQILRAWGVPQKLYQLDVCFV